MGNFKERYAITSNWQYGVIIIVFALTGSTSAFVAKPILAFLGITKTTFASWIYWMLYVILIFPVYQIILLSFGFLFGQFKFFWLFEKNMLRTLKLGFIVDFFEKK